MAIYVTGKIREAAARAIATQFYADHLGKLPSCESVRDAVDENWELWIYHADRVINAIGPTIAKQVSKQVLEDAFERLTDIINEDDD